VLIGVRCSVFGLRCSLTLGREALEVLEVFGMAAMPVEVRLLL
jgi:hypothetical protein